MHSFFLLDLLNIAFRKWKIYYGKSDFIKHIIRKTFMIIMLSLVHKSELRDALNIYYDVNSKKHILIYLFI